MTRLGWLEKWTLRYAVVALIWLAVNGFEGILMRTQLLAPHSPVLASMEAPLNLMRPVPQEPSTIEVFYSMLTAHPICGVYGFAYMAVMGAFYFLVPWLLKKEIRYRRLVPFNFWLQIIAVFTAWGAGFFLLFNSLYTLYWPLPVSYDRVPLVGSVVFAIGAAGIMINVLLFSFNIFSTVLSKSNPRSYSFGEFLLGAFGISALLKRLGWKKAENPGPSFADVPVFIVSVARGSVDTVINAIVLLVAGGLVLVYGLAELFKMPLDPAMVDALIYKNWFWWGLDMVADGNVLIYSAGVWYLLVPLLVGRNLYGEKVVRTVILADLLVSLGVWSHHLLSDQPQPMVMRILSGQFITWGEFLTMGLSVFAALATIWLARPVRLTPALKFVLGSIFGFAIGGMAGLVQANTGFNLVLHNTQWVIGIHAHTQLLVGLGMLLFAVIYALLPLLTKLEIRSTRLADIHFWTWLVGAMVMNYATGLAGAQGMLRRTLYDPPVFAPNMAWALAGSLLMSVGFVAFLANLVITLGWGNLVQLVLPDRRGQPQPAAA
jgi:cytochrome c oxidase subunit 1